MNDPTPAPATSRVDCLSLVAGLDLLTHRERDADGLAHGIIAALADRGVTDSTVATHWARVGQLRHIALTIECDAADADVLSTTLAEIAAADGATSGLLLPDRYIGEVELRDTLAEAVTAHTSRGSGRAVAFRGLDALCGLMPVKAVLACSVIDRVHVLAGGHAEPDTMLNTRNFLRPRWRDGELVLDTQPAAGGTLVPFESPFPTPCCADHA